MSRIGLSNYIDCKSTNSGDSDVVSCVGCEPGHEVLEETWIRSQVTNHHIGITYLIRHTQNIGDQHPQYLGP